MSLESGLARAFGLKSDGGQGLVPRPNGAALRRCQCCRGTSSATNRSMKSSMFALLGGPDHEFGQTRRHVCIELTVQLRPVARDEVGGIDVGPAPLDRGNQSRPARRRR